MSKILFFFGEMSFSNLEKLRFELRLLVKENDKLIEFSNENKNNMTIIEYLKNTKSGFPDKIENTKHKKKDLII
jgi:hypothetical protein